MTLFYQELSYPVELSQSLICTVLRQKRNTKRKVLFKVLPWLCIQWCNYRLGENNRLLALFNITTKRVFKLFLKNTMVSHCLHGIPLTTTNISGHSSPLRCTLQMISYYRLLIRFCTSHDSMTSWQVTDFRTWRSGQHSNGPNLFFEYFLYWFATSIASNNKKLQIL